jgi:hypothetical protein
MIRWGTLAFALLLAGPVLAQLAGPAPTTTGSRPLPTTTQTATTFIAGRVFA